MTNIEILETRILIADIIGSPPDDVEHIYAKGFSKPHWFFAEHKKNPEYNTLLFFSDKPCEHDIFREIDRLDDVIDEWDGEEY